MATIKFSVYGKKDPVNLNIRFFHNKIDCSAKSNIFLEKDHWSDKTGRIKQTAPDDVKKRINEFTDGLTKFVLEVFAKDFPAGNAIDSNWLAKQVDNFFGKPDDLNDFRFYFVPFIEKFIIDSKTRLNPKSGKKISPRTIST